MASTSAISKVEGIATSAIAQILQFQQKFLNTTYVGLKKEFKLSYVAAAVAVLIASGIYKILSPPRRLAHITHIPALATVRSIAGGSSHVERAKNMLLPKDGESNGLVVKFAQFGWEVTVLRPEIARAVLCNPDMYPKTDSLAEMRTGALIRRFFGKTNLAMCNGDEWRRRRKIANPAFHRSMPVKAFGQLTGRLIQQLGKADGPVEIQPLLQRFTLDVIGRIGFGFEFNATGAPDGDWVHAYNSVSDNILAFPYIFWPILDTTFQFLFPRRQEKHADLTALNDLFTTMIKTKREEIASRKSEVEDAEKDLLTLLIESGRGENDDSEPLTDGELRSELVLFFFAGHDTTANALAFTLYFLAANPDIQDRARKETLDLLGDELEDVYPNIEQIKQLQYLTRVIKESSRLANPATSIVQRTAAKDTELDGYFIPKDTLVNIDIIALHYNPRYWKNPEVFDPERFIDGGELDSQSPFPAYMPFGGGIRQCIGMNFSLAEQRVALAAILKKYEVSLPADSPHKNGLQFGSLIFTLTPKDLLLNFKRRY